MTTQAPPPKLDVATAGKEGSEPPQPYIHLPEPLKVTLLRSYQDRKDGVAGAAQNLSVCFDKGANVWEAIDAGMSFQDLNTMVRVYQRLEAVDETGALWRDHMKYFVRAYTYGIYAVELVYTEREELKPYLDAISRRSRAPMLANASGFFQCMHGRTVGWREVSRQDQLHITVAAQKGASGAPGEAPVVEDCHIDETSFTAGRRPDGTAEPAYFSGLKHFLQSQFKWIDIDRPFAKLDAILRAPKDLPKRPWPAGAIAALEDWEKRRGAEAVSGEAGHRNAVTLLRAVQRFATP